MRPGTCGRPFKGVDVTILNPDANGNGEIVTCARNVFMGYNKDEAKTRETFTEDGKCRSGDLGSYDSDGFLRLTGRLKEIVVTAGGENVAPIPIEGSIKDVMSSFIRNALIIGDRRKFLSCLVTLRTVLNPDGSPSEVLEPSVAQWAKLKGVDDIKTVSDFTNSPKLMREIQKYFDKVNKKTVSRATEIRKWRILPVDFSLQGGEVGPTLKIKRFFIMEKYKDLIEDMYKDQK